MSHKVDLTSVGHWSGSGMIVFGEQKIELVPKVPRIIPAFSEKRDWTVVSAYFNLPKRLDASSSIKERDTSFYMQHAHTTMSIEQNLVLFCDEESVEHLRKLRPAYLQHKTKYIVLDFSQLHTVQKYYDKVCASRNKTKYNADPRNTPSYYLLCMARYEMLERVMQENPFGCTHFAWCNICIERMDWKCGKYLPRVWEEYRDKFSTCYIDYQPKSLVQDSEKYYQGGGRCSMCSGFFTGSKYYLSEFCKEIQIAFTDMLDKDLGHADEQLFSIVYFKKPHLFQFYYGDYCSMIVNYTWIHDSNESVVNHFMKNLSNSGENLALLKDVIQRWLYSYNCGYFKTTLETTKKVLEYKKKLEVVNTFN
jgi:hypothetical protein